jgi:hypothetical protein
VARTYAWIIIVYAMVTVFDGSSTAVFVFQPHRLGFCGNVVSDPLRLQFNYLLPAAWCCAIAMVRLNLRSQQWPLICPFAAVLLVVITVSLLAITRFLAVEYALGISPIWWLPFGLRQWLLGR